ncbi:FAD-binding oxidoreductase [Kineosporia rhizophila]|uniref:FAD-binding oxidoreductase n=1 Tax=Kineosporia TaxID=49184 RepID=UPI001E329A7F|nr:MULTISPECIES: FAD-binding oxidoreductase [Kineosporia]MCE0535182.1 FAD-binding oxidoreductase [Kineosporia rhizophila]GLY14531.1 6-hydroxy-D-nicotine oxidase [Kineosporia sp. NBRC 101677]
MRLWNAAISTRPAQIVRCGTNEQVSEAVRNARREERPVSVLGGGHDWAGRAVREGGVVIDLSPMNRVAVSGDVALAGGGATSLDVMEASVTAGQTVVAGSVGSVGMAGLALGGGYGPQLGSAGLASDMIVGADVVLADGSLVVADAEHEPDLFWALRGGGGNFGVVTELRLRLRPFATALAGSILFPWSQAEDVLNAWAQTAPSVPDELSVHVGGVGLPDGTRVIAANPTWVGEAAEGAAWVRRIEGWGVPLVSQVARLPLTEPLRATEQMFAADGRGWYLRNRNLPGLTPDIVGALVEAFSAAPSGHEAFGLHHFHGQATRVAPEATAFGERRPHLMLELIAAWRDEDPAPHRQWAAEAWSALEPLALPGGYPNILAADDTAQIAAAWGPNTQRLRQVKQAYDPEDSFAGIPLP